MSNGELLNERTCDECGQATMTRHWQEVNFCANCGVEADPTERDREEHLSFGMSLSREEIAQLVNDEEIALTRALRDDRHVTLHLRKAHRSTR